MSRIRLGETGNVRNNKWPHDKEPPQLPLLPDKYQGPASGLLLEATWDAAIGPEVYLVIFDPCRREELATCAGWRPLQLLCSATIGRTDHGLVLLLLWTIHDGPKGVAWYKLFLDPHRMDTLKLLSAWSQQTHLKVFVVNSLDQRVECWGDFENRFDVNRLIMTVVKNIAHENQGNFQLAQKQFLQEHSVEELLGEVWDLGGVDPEEWISGAAS